MLPSHPQGMDPPAPAAMQRREPNGSEGITDEHRNGSITAIGIVLGFSLTFLSSWMHGPEPWDYTGIVILLTVASGIALQIISLRRLLILPQAPGLRHSLTHHNRAATPLLVGNGSSIRRFSFVGLDFDGARSGNEQSPHQWHSSAQGAEPKRAFRGVIEAAPRGKWIWLPTIITPAVVVEQNPTAIILGGLPPAQGTGSPRQWNIGEHGYLHSGGARLGNTDICILTGPDLGTRISAF